MRKTNKIIVILLLLTGIAVATSYFYLPVNRVGVTSELIMLGDFNNDNIWDNQDTELLKTILRNPFVTDSLTQFKIDINQNGLIDQEDKFFLEYLNTFSNPYSAELAANRKGMPFPRPREMFHYLPRSEYVQRPIYFIQNDIVTKSPFSFLQKITLEHPAFGYRSQLIHQIYDEAVRFSLAYDIRKDTLTRIEREYAHKKIRYCNTLYEQNNYYELLLNLFHLVEDIETLTITTQSEFLKKILFFRDHLKEILVSDSFSSFTQGESTYLEIFKQIEKYLQTDLDLSIELGALSSPRDFSNLQNYLDRAEWQAFKSKTKNEFFKELVLYAQYDRRYLRAVSKTSPKLEDIQLQNHNLPMILLFRKALEITGNDKKAALGLLDEAVRIPMAWVKSIPKEMLPSSIALENFLLPGNKEDGSDKTRHWSVFGGVAIYKSPQESLMLALKREIMDLKTEDYTPHAMREFIRDTIANINGIYYVVSINPDLLVDLRSEEK